MLHLSVHYHGHVSAPEARIQPLLLPYQTAALTDLHLVLAPAVSGMLEVATHNPIEYHSVPILANLAFWWLLIRLFTNTSQRAAMIYKSIH